MKKKLLVAAIGATMGAATVAQADGLLFPLYEANSAAGVYSFITLANVLNQDSDLHYIWNFDRTDTAALECVHEDAFGNLTAWDISQATVTSPTLSGLDLPNHPQFLDASAVNYSLAEPTLGFMIVTNWDEGAYGVTAQGESTLAGQMIVVDWATLLKMRGQPEQWDIFVTHHSFVPDPILVTFLNDRLTNIMFRSFIDLLP